MSLFRKPRKIQRRVFCADDDEEDGEPEAPPPPVISQEKEVKEKKSVKTTALLSFADEEEEECEVFKVKKSSQSKRISKRRDKEKKRPFDGDNNRYDNNGHEDNNDNGVIPMEVDEQKPKKKKITLEGLILSGREALAADGAGDISDDDEPDEGGKFPQYRPESVRAALAVAAGDIPDAALIHAARKTRQQARELGGDYVPLKPEAGPGSRLVRDDDGSGDDEEEGRIAVRGLELPSDRPQRGTAAATPEEELNSDVEEWEEQQLQKARPVIADITGDNTEVNPFAVPLPVASTKTPLRPLLVDSERAPASAQDLVDALRNRMEELRGERAEAQCRRAAGAGRLAGAVRARDTRAARRAALDTAYRRAQAARGYLTDLIECLDEKMPKLEALEARALAMHKRRCDFLVERRRADVRDQAQDVLAMAARPGSVKPVDSEEKIRRAAEREGRRRARRLKREATAAAAGAHVRHRDGDSSDDELPPHELHHYTQERAAIRAESAQLFSDALSAWRGVRGVCRRLARWRAADPALYCDAYVADSLPRLLAPYVRHEMILWNPLADEDNEDYERMDWYKCLMMYGVRNEKTSSDSSDSDMEHDGHTVVTESSVRDDIDLMLVPTIVGRVVIPKLTELVEQAWDPMCVRACVRLRALVSRAAAVPRARPALARLATALHATLHSALNADVFLPALPPAVLEGGGGGFWRRCVGAGVRLLRGALALVAPPALLRADALVLQLVERLSFAAGAAAGPQAAWAASVLAGALPRGELRPHALRPLRRLATTAMAALQPDNPLHMKALEQVRAILSEAEETENKIEDAQKQTKHNSRM